MNNAWKIIEMQLVVFSKRLQTLLRCYRTRKSSVHFCVNTTAKSWLGQFREKQSVFCTAAELWNQFTGFSLSTWFPVQHKLNYNMHQSAIISKKYMLHMLICIRPMGWLRQVANSATAYLVRWQWAWPMNSGLLSMVFRRVLSNYRVIIERLLAVSPYFC